MAKVKLQVIRSSNSEHWFWQLVLPNHQVLETQAIFSQKKSAIKAAERFIQSIYEAGGFEGTLAFVERSSEDGELVEVEWMN